MDRGLVKVFNTVTKLRRARCRPEELLILVPSCLQNSECTATVRTDINACLRCGKCKVKDIVELAERHGGVRCAVATGGRLALELANDKSVKAVIAVACEKELRAGMTGVFPKPGLGIINLRPNGPCVDTDFDLAELEEAVSWILRD